jgi:DNA-binding transcriptional ArsR family regulator
MVKSFDRDELSAVFHALADPTRRAILRRLAKGDLSVTKLAEPHDISLPAISKHLKVLENAGLVSRLRIGSSHLIQLRVGNLKAASRWLSFYEAAGAAEQLQKLEELPTR